MHIGKIFNVNRSSAIIVPAAYRRMLGWKNGDHLYCLINKEGNLEYRSLADAKPLAKKTFTRGTADLTKVTASHRGPRD